MKLAPAILIVTLAAAGLAGAQGPQLLVRDPRGGTAPLRIEEVSIDVTVAGDVAETTILVGFRNETARLLEGDFVMPLPPGATVSSYALEVNGAMREGVAVEKQRARNAYESIKRQMIDPGLVEREAGNVYRTRIFPIPANGTKMVRLGYVEHLRSVDGKRHYELPCNFPGPVAQFSCRIKNEGGSGLVLAEAPGLVFTEDPSGQLAATASGKPIQGKLVLHVTPPKAPVLLMESGGDAMGAYFYLTDRVPDHLPEAPQNPPKRIRLIWDASESRRLEPRELAVLDAYFQKIGYAAVRLQLLRNSVHEAGVFPVRDGRWDTLRTALEGVYYDGASRFDLLPLDRIEEDIALLCTDGLAPLGLPTVPANKPLFLVNGAAQDVHPRWKRIVQPSGGATLDLARLNEAEAIHKLTTHALQIVSVEGEGVNECNFDPDVSPGQAVRISGRIKQEKTGTLLVNYGHGRTILATTRVPVRTGEDPESGFPHRLWAQDVLEDLESNEPVDEAGIVFHCKHHGLVSAFTSLIVLERFEDHVRYEIPPPEADLRRRYDQAISNKRARTPANSLANIIRSWEWRKIWHQREFPWMEIALLPRLEQVTIWTKAVSKVFRKDDLDQSAFAEIDDWRREVLATVQRRQKLQTEAQLKAWQQDIGRLVRLGSALRKTPIAIPPDGKPLVVSVRGLVRDPGNISGGPGLTLRQAISQAGGIYSLGSETNVELYRNAGKTVYNMASSQFKDLALRPGDMVVVGEEYYPDDYWQDVDPFSEAPPQPELDFSERPAVVEDSDVWISDRSSGDGDPFAGNSARGGASNLPAGSRNPPPADSPLALTGSIRPGRTAKDPGPAMEKFRNALAAGGDAEAAYRTLRSEGRYPASFYVETVRLLVAHQHPQLARQVLSNLVETDEFDLERILAAAMWLTEFERWDAAADLLAMARRTMPSALLPTYQSSLLAMQRDEKLTALRGFQEALKQCQRKDATNPGASTIALTDLNGLVARMKLARQADLPNRLRGNLDADLRMVVMASNPDLHFRLAISEPSGHTCRGDSPCGGRIDHTRGLAEYTMRRAMPGCYTVTCQSPYPVTVRAILYQNWGRESQTSRTVTLLLKGGRPETLAECEFSFKE